MFALYALSDGGFQRDKCVIFGKTGKTTKIYFAMFGNFDADLRIWKMGLVEFLPIIYALIVQIHLCRSSVKKRKMCGKYYFRKINTKSANFVKKTLAICMVDSV